MATITYTFVDRCAGGGHTRLDVSVNGNPAQRITYDTADILRPLSDLPDDRQDMLKLLILNAHMSGKTQPEIAAELANPVTVTI